MMNKYQLIALWIGIIIIAALCVFPPEYYHNQSHRVNLERLIPYCVAVAIITAGLIVTFSSPKVAKAVLLLLRVLIYGLIIIFAAAGISYLIALEINETTIYDSTESTKSKSKYSHLLEENRRQTEGDQKKKGKYADILEEFGISRVGPPVPPAVQTKTKGKYADLVEEYYKEEEEKQERVNSADCNLPYDTDQ